jgi:hypothetical protein
LKRAANAARENTVSIDSGFIGSGPLPGDHPAQENPPEVPDEQNPLLSPPMKLAQLINLLVLALPQWGQSNRESSSALRQSFSKHSPQSSHLYS